MMGFHVRIRATGQAAFLALFAAVAQAGPADGTASAFLEAQDGTRLQIGSVALEQGRFEVSFDNSLFSEHFLSMRPFKCLEGPDIHLCHVPYPYDLPRRIENGDLTDLEYDFLFLWKGAGEYGINMWNGVYYRLEDQGDRLVGTLHEMDMGKLAVPPDPSVRHPIRAQDLEEGDPDSHWLPRLVIE